MKNKNIHKNINFFIALLIIFSTSIIDAQQLVVSGKKIVNSSNGQEVILNAMNTGNSMVIEGYFMNSTSEAPDQHTWRKKLTALIGATNTKTFFDAWLNNHVTQADVTQLKAWGFNAVRVPLHHEYFVSENAPYVWNEQGFTLLTNYISWCSDAGMYVIIDLHAAPGGQSNNAISDYDNTKPSLWESTANQDKTVALWKEISRRYKNEPWVAGYDLINETAWSLPNNNALLRNIYNRITTEIRTNNNDNHILFIEGNSYSNDHNGLTPAWDANMVYVFHKYWSDATSLDIKWITDFRNTWNRPIWCGEHGENSNDHFTKIVETFNANGIGFSWWPMKKFKSTNDFATANLPGGYKNLLNHFAGSFPSLDPTTAFNTVMQLAENVKLENCSINTEVLRSIFIQPGNRDTEAFTTNVIPGKIYAPNYDKGMNGYAYSDQAWEDVRLTTGNYTAWNNGWVYRNNGVDIEATSDPLSNGYAVGWFASGEWMKYTVNVNQAGTYSVSFRVANGSGSPATVQIQNAAGTEILATATIPSTGSWSTWTNVLAAGVFRTSGSQGIKIVNTAGSFNINSVNFVYEDATIPAPVPTVKTADIINLKGNNGKYVTFSGVDNLMSSTSTNLGSNQTFTVVDAGNGLVALKGNNNNYVTLNPSNNRLYCNATTIGDYQKFTLTDLCGVYNIKGFNNLYVSSENGSTAGLTCFRTGPSGWEYFNWGISGTVVVLSTKSFENKTSNYTVFPNPAQNAITISSLTAENAEITIYDLNGRTVINTSINGNQKDIDVNQISKGFYLMKIVGSDKTTDIVKFIKE